MDKKRKNTRGKKSKAVKGKTVTCSVPEEVIPFIFQFLTWRDGYRLALVSKAWNAAHRSMLQPSSPVHVGLQWRSCTYESERWDDILNMFSPTDACFGTQFAPQLALITVSGAAHYLRRSNGWEKLFKALDAKKLLPNACAIVGMYSDFGIISSTLTKSGYDIAELESSHVEDMVVNVTVGYFPDTKIELIQPTKLDIRDGLEECKLNSDTNTILVYSANGTQCDALIHHVSAAHPTANIVGTILPFTDRCVPIATRNAMGNRLEMTNPSHVCIGFTGRTKSVSFSSLGFQISSPIVQCEQVRVIRHPYFRFMHTFESVSVMRRNSSSAMSVAPIELLADITEPSGNVYLFKADTADKMAAFIQSPGSIELDRVVCIYDKQHGFIFSQADTATSGDPWHEGMYGVFCTQSSQAAKFDFTESLKAAKAALPSSATVLGGVSYPCAARGEGFYGEENVESTMFAEVFPQTPLAGVISGGEIGPVAMPGGSNARERKTELQSYTTCGAVFYYC